MAVKVKPEKFARMFLKILVYDNRVEIRDGAWPFVKVSVIPFKNIATVGIGKFTKRLEITTNDGKTLRYGFFSQRKTRRCRDAIAGRL